MARLSVFVAAFVLVAAFVVGSSAAPSTAGSKTFINYLGGGLSFCSQCGSPGKYACSNNVGNWTNGFEFVDPIPRGSIVSRVDVTLLGSYACDVTPSVVEVDINGVPVDILESGGSNACQCGSCDGTWKFSSVYAPFNLPYYSYGDLNGISITNLAGSICLNSVNITIYWDAPQYPGTLGASMRWNMNRYRDVQVCNLMGYDTSSQQTLSFTDPLPKGSLLIMAGVRVFGSFWCYSSTAVSPTITATLGSTTVGTIKLESRGSAQSNCRTTVECDGGVWTSSSNLYQSGWPKYVYGGVNNLRIDTTYYPRLGSVTLYISYIVSGKLVSTQVNIQE